MFSTLTLSYNVYSGELIFALVRSIFAFLIKFQEFHVYMLVNFQILIAGSLSSIFPWALTRIFRSKVTFKVFPVGGIRSSRPEVSSKKGVLKIVVKFTGKHLCQSLPFKKVAW